MSPTVVGLLALALIVVVVARSVVLSRRRAPGPVALESDRSRAWLKHAGETAREGREIADDLETPIHATEASVPPDLQRRLDDLTRHLAELATTAPTAMDVRVCRGVAVSSQSLGSALGPNDGHGEMPGDVPVGGRELLDRHAQFVMALGDLERHVDLL